MESMQAVLSPTRYSQALASLLAVDEAVARAQHELTQVMVLRREAAFLSGLLQGTSHHEAALDLCEELAAQPVELDAVHLASHALHAALYASTPA